MNTPEQVLDQWEMRRKLSRWRWASLLFFSTLLLMSLSNWGVFDHKTPVYGSYIARVQLEGAIISDQGIVEHFKSIADNHNVKAVFVHINSPGGAAVGGEMLYKALREVSAQKPVVALLDDIAASAGYMVALGADRIVAHRTTLTGSIGALIYSVNFQELAEKLGVKAETFKSSPFKALPNPLESTTPEVQHLMYETVWDVYQTFFTMVHERRNMSVEDLAKVADGRVMTGNQAFAAGLVDELGGEEVAMQWLISQNKIATQMPIYDVDYGSDDTEYHRLLKPIAAIAKGTYAAYRMTLGGVW